MLSTGDTKESNQNIIKNICKRVYTKEDIINFANFNKELSPKIAININYGWQRVC